MRKKPLNKFKSKEQCLKRFERVLIILKHFFGFWPFFRLDASIFVEFSHFWRNFEKMAKF